MRVMTLHQPYATLIALGVKTIETRPNKTNVRGRIAIHAAAREPDAQYLGDYAIGLLDPTPATRRMWRTDVHENTIGLPLGAIVATANLVDCVPINSGHDGTLIGFSPYHEDWSPPHPWAGRGWGLSTIGGSLCVTRSEMSYGDFRPSRWAWLLDDVEPLATPVPFKGGQGWSKSWDPS